MKINEIINSLNKKLKEIKNIRNLNSREPGFKSWYVSTLSVLKNLPGTYFKDVAGFKKISFTDTKYHRGKNIYNPADTNRYNMGLSEAENILKRIIMQAQKSLVQKPAEAKNKKADKKSD